MIPWPTLVLIGALCGLSGCIAYVGVAVFSLPDTPIDSRSHHPRKSGDERASDGSGAFHDGGLNSQTGVRNHG